MNQEQARLALRAHKALVRIASHPEREPAWSRIIADLMDAEAFYGALGDPTPDEVLDYRRIRAALKR